MGMATPTSTRGSSRRSRGLMSLTIIVLLLLNVWSISQPRATVAHAAGESHAPGQRTVTSTRVNAGNLAPMTSKGSGDLTWHSGAILHSPTVYAIFWGSYWGSGSGPAEEQSTVNFLRGLSGSSYAGVLTQYYDNSGHATTTINVGGVVTDTQQPPTTSDCGVSTAVNSGSVQAEAGYWASYNNWPTSGNVLYIVYMPPTIVVDDTTSFWFGLFDAGCSNAASGWCGIHATDPYPAGSNFPYATIIYPGSGCMAGGSNANSLASTTAHETFEAITNPYPGSSTGAWYDSGWNEIGDKCNQQIADVNGTWLVTWIGGNQYYVQEMYDNAAHDCTQYYQDVYAVGANGHLYDYHWHDYQGWTINDISGAPSAALTGTASGSTFVQDSQLVQDVFVNDVNGHVQEYWKYPNTSWNHADHTPSGITFTGSPSGVSFTFPGQTNINHSVYDIGTNGHLYYLSWEEYVHGWQVADLNSVSGTPAVAFTFAPSGTAFVQSGAEYQTTYARGNDGRLYEYWWTNNTWHENCVSCNVGALPNSATVDSGPSAVSFVYPGQSAMNHAIFVMGSDGYLYDFHWQQGSSWSWTSVAGSSGNYASLTDSPSAHFLIQSGTGVLDAYARSDGGQLIEYWNSTGSTQSSGWNSGNDSVAAGANITFNGSPSGISYNLPIGQNNAPVRHSVYVVTTDGHLREFLWVQGGGSWALLDHGAPYGTSVAAGSEQASSSAG